ncbi:response regulator [Marinoscillum furvescens]|uniref:Two-component system response regulator n=1 Tax=Marinoscillum furvescens DSM 4134 TaxID=1122208 RepID=A0A3D9KWM5_MARFU|nr:response regulator [Marinoscillum furvescens]RED92651.1 two-component system response regulator [Marinoscillum furvescens DSM 4134]
MNNNLDILLVEDNPDDASLALRVLKKVVPRENIVWVNDGAEALDFMFAKRAYADRDPSIQPRLILLDLKLPKRMGVEVLEEIKANASTCEIPVVVLTSSKQEKDLAKCYKLGANSYVVKPIDFDQFTEAAKNISTYWLMVNQVP